MLKHCDYGKPLIIGLTLSSASLVFVLVVAEIVIRVFAPQDLIRSMPAQIDPEIIYTLSPNTEAYLKGSSVVMYHLKTNSHGLREREIPFSKPPGSLRILLLGDSMSMAEGVEMEEIYLKKLEKLLNFPGKRLIETVNGAIRGYGNDQELILFQQLLVKFDADIVILAFYTGNDVEDNWNGQLFEVRDGELVQKAPTSESSIKYRYYSKQARLQNLPGYMFLMRHSHFANWIRTKCAEIIYRRIYKSASQIQEQERRKTKPLSETPAYILTEAILKEWKMQVLAAGASPYIMVIPYREDVLKLRKDPGLGITRVDIAVEKFCRSNDIPVLNLTHKMIRWRGDFEGLWLGEGHLSPVGHEWVAQELFKDLKKTFASMR